MAKITKDDVDLLARQSNVSMTVEETEQLVVELSKILDYIDQLQELDTEGVEPTYHLSGLHNIWREDAVAEKTVTREALLDLAPDSQNNQIKVPKVL